MNFELLKAGYQIAIIKAEQRVNYYQALRLGDNCDYEMIGNAVIETMEYTLSAIGAQ